MVTFGFDLVHFIIILSISTATTGGGVLFSSRCQWSRKVGLFWPIWAILLQIYALFLVYSYSAKLCSGVAKLTNIRYALSIVFIFLKVFFSAVKTMISLFPKWKLVCSTSGKCTGKGLKWFSSMIHPICCNSDDFVNDFVLFQLKQGK